MNRLKLSILFIFVILLYSASGYFMGYVIDMAFMTSDYYGKAIAFTTAVVLIVLFFIIVTIVREGKELTREEMIEILLVRTGIKKEILVNMSDEEIKKIYAERVLSRGML